MIDQDQRRRNFFLKPNGQAPRRQAQLETCEHPKSARWVDVENGEVVCRGDLGGCGQVLERQSPRASDIQKFGRGPTNSAVFRSNLGTTSKSKSNRPGPEPAHLHALASTYGGTHGHLGSLIQTRTCPSCRTQQTVRLFNDGGLVCENETCGSLVCGKCSSLKVEQTDGEIKEGEQGNLHCSFGASVSEDLTCSKYGEIKGHVKFMRTHLGDYLLRWNPANNGNGLRRSFWSDLRSLQSWDGPEDDVIIRSARELFSRRLNGKLSDENAHVLATMYLKAVRELSAEKRRELKRLLPGILDSCLRVVGVEA